MMYVDYLSFSPTRYTCLSGGGYIVYTEQCRLDFSYVGFGIKRDSIARLSYEGFFATHITAEERASS